MNQRTMDCSYITDNQYADYDEHYLKEELYSLIKSDSMIFDFLQAGSLDGIWYWDLEKTGNEWMSPQFWKTLGVDPDEKQHLSQEWQNIIFPEDLEVALDNFYKHCKDPNHHYDQVVRYHHRNGSTVWIRCRGIAIRDKQGKPIRMLGAHTDITQLKQSEENLKQANRELSAFAYAASHDLKAPLRTIKGMILILQQQFFSNLADEGKELFSHVISAAQRMTQLINGLLQYAKLTEEADINESVNCEVLIQDILKDLSADIKSTNAIITVDVCHFIQGNAIILRQLFQNLIGNALKYHRTGIPPQITVSSQTLANCWEFSITDNGQGIDAQHFERIFQLLKRLHSSSEVEGNGLGLNLSQKAVAYHGGQIWLTSEVGKGSTFYFTIKKDNTE